MLEIILKRITIAIPFGIFFGILPALSRQRGIIKSLPSTCGTYWIVAGA